MQMMWMEDYKLFINITTVSSPIKSWEILYENIFKKIIYKK